MIECVTLLRGSVYWNFCATTSGLTTSLSYGGVCIEIIAGACLFNSVTLLRGSVYWNACMRICESMESLSYGGVCIEMELRLLWFHQLRHSPMGECVLKLSTLCAGCTFVTLLRGSVYWNLQRILFETKEVTLLRGSVYWNHMLFRFFRDLCHSISFFFRRWSVYLYWNLKYFLLIFRIHHPYAISCVNQESLSF